MHHLLTIRGALGGPGVDSCIYLRAGVFSPGGHLGCGRWASRGVTWVMLKKFYPKKNARKQGVFELFSNFFGGVAEKH